MRSLLYCMAHLYKQARCVIIKVSAGGGGGVDNYKKFFPH